MDFSEESSKKERPKSRFKRFSSSGILILLICGGMALYDFHSRNNFVLAFKDNKRYAQVSKTGLLFRSTKFTRNYQEPNDPYEAFSIFQPPFKQRLLYDKGTGTKPLDGIIDEIIKYPIIGKEITLTKENDYDSHKAEFDRATRDAAKIRARYMPKISKIWNE